MSGVVTWALSILGVALLGMLVDLLLTKSRLKPYIRSVFAVITALVVVTPLPGMLRAGGSVDWKIELTDTSFLEYASDLKLHALERAVERALLEQEGVQADVKIEGRADKDIEITSVYVDLSQNGITDNPEHIYKYDSVQESTANYLGIDKERVTVR